MQGEEICFTYFAVIREGGKQLFVVLSCTESFWNKIKQNQKRAKKVANSRVPFFTKKTASNLHRQADTKERNQSWKLPEKHTQFQRLMRYTKLLQDWVKQSHSVRQKSGRVQDPSVLFASATALTVFKASDWEVSVSRQNLGVFIGFRDFREEEKHPKYLAYFFAAVQVSQRRIHHWRGQEKIIETGTKHLCCCSITLQLWIIHHRSCFEKDTFQKRVLYTCTCFYKVGEPQVNLSSLKIIVSSQRLLDILQKAQEQ